MKAGPVGPGSGEAMGEANDLTLGAVQALLVQLSVRMVQIHLTKPAETGGRFACAISLVVPAKPGLTTLHAFGDTLGDALAVALDEAALVREEEVADGK
jgi:hypothetical protein